MCCYSENKYVVALADRNPDDYMIGYKVFDVVDGDVLTPHRGFEIDPNDQILRAYRPLKPLCKLRTLRFREIRGGAIHFYKMEASTCYISNLAGDKRKTVAVRVYAQVSDIIGVDYDTACASKIIIDFDDLAKLRKIAMKQKIK